MKIETFDRSSCRVLRDKLQAVLAEAGIEGVEFEVGNMRFTANEVSIKLTAKTAGAEGERLDVVAQMAKLHGIASTERDGWRLVDYHPKKRKYPFIAENPRGTRYKMDVQQAQNRFGVAA